MDIYEHKKNLDKLQQSVKVLEQRLEKLHRKNSETSEEILATRRELKKLRLQVFQQDLETWYM